MATVETVYLGGLRTEAGGFFPLYAFVFVTKVENNFSFFLWQVSLPIML